MGKWGTLSNLITLEAHSARHQDTGADEISIEGLAGTSLAMNAHSAAVTGIHGAGTGTIAVIADITTHAALTTVHSLGSMAQAASADYASTTVYASHTASNAVHGAGTVASLADLHNRAHTVSATADHVFPSGTANYLRADGTWAEPPTGSGTPSGTVVAETAYGAGSVAGTSLEYSRGDHTHGSPADLVSGTAHASLATGIHGAGTATIAVTADITTHAGSTGTHGAGTIASLANIASHASSTNVHGAGTIAALADIVSHSGSTAVHGAGTVAALLDVTTHATASSGIHGSGTAALATTSQITTHAGLTATHGVAGTIAAKADITDTVIVLADVTTNDVTSTKHGFAPKSPANTGLFLNGGATPAWAAPPGGTGILSTTYKSGTQAFSSTALANVTGMNFACASTTLYHYKFVVMHKTGTVTVGMKWSLTYPASTIAAGRVSMGVTASGTTAYFHGLISVSGTAVTGTSQIAAGTIGVAIIEGIVKSTAAGSIQLQAAAEAAGTVWVMDCSVGLLYAII